MQDKELDRMINGEPVASQIDQLNGDSCSNDDISRPDEGKNHQDHQRSIRRQE